MPASKWFVNTGTINVTSKFGRNPHVKLKSPPSENEERAEAGMPPPPPPIEPPAKLQRPLKKWRMHRRHGLETTLPVPRAMRIARHSLATLHRLTSRSHWRTTRRIPRQRQRNNRHQKWSKQTHPKLKLCALAV